jgi:hypothetical protein
VNEFGLYRRLEKTFGGILEFWDQNFLEHMADKAELESIDYGRKKVEAEQKHLNGLHHSYNYG